MDTLLDKIFSPTKHSEASLIQKLTGPQMYRNDSSSLLQNMPIEYQQQLLEDSLYSCDFNTTASSNAFKTNLQSLFRTFNHTMLPHIPKVPPCSNLIQEYHRLFSNSLDTVANSVSDLSILLDNMPQKTKKKHTNAEVAAAGSDHLVVSIADALSPNNKANFNVTISKTMMNTPKKIPKEDCNLDQQMANRKIPKEDCNLDQQMANRKAKELQKRSKKRRRRQKKSNSSSITPKNAENHKIQVSCDASKESPISANEEKQCDIVCDVTVSHSSKSVQIVLPNLSSFVVTIESGDDDSDWDTNNETDWLTDDSEFQVSGLFVASFSASNACPLLAYESDNKAQKQELSLMEAKLKEVNRVWNEHVDCLETKQKSANLVSFAPNEELEEICPVEMYDRKGEWEVFATERLRFKKRIQETEDVLSPCLLPDHRAKIYSSIYESTL